MAGARGGECGSGWAWGASAVFRSGGSGAEEVVVEQYARPREEYVCMLRELTGSVVESVGGMLTAAPVEEEVGAAAGLAGRGVRVRLAYPRELLAVPAEAVMLGRAAEAGAEVRVLDHVPHDLVVFDGRTVCLAARPAAPGGADEPLVRVSGTALARSFAAIFTAYWERAVPLSRTSAGPHHARLGGRERAVVRLMTSGLSDERIAERLGMAAADVQAVVSALMARLDAGSRFEAGYKLARELDPREL